MNDTPPTFVSAPEIARAAGVSNKTLVASLKRLSEMPDAILSAGRFQMPIYSVGRVAGLLSLVNGGKVPPPTLEAQ